MATSVIVKVIPNSSRDMLIAFSEGITGDLILRIGVTAAPDKGQANKAMQELLAKSLTLPKSTVGIVKGKTSRLKIIAIDADAEFVHDRLKEIIKANNNVG